MSQPSHVRVEFYQPPPDLERFFTTFYVVEINVTGDYPVVDYLHPEWGNLRLLTAATVEAGGEFQNKPGQGVVASNFIATGPSARAVRLSAQTTRLWGIGLLPLGWARFVRTPAGSLANTVMDGNRHPAMARFAPLAAGLFDAPPDPAREVARITAFFRAWPAEPVADEARILAIHTALVDPDIVTVAALVERAGASARTVERVCFRDFGFPPKLLMRRQRFMRSLSEFMLDPSLKWIDAIDSQYHDQAQFVRDFKQFMGMTPRQYASMAHPVLDVLVRERMRLSGSAVQALDGPRGSSTGRSYAAVSNRSSY